MPSSGGLYLAKTPHPAGFVVTDTGIYEARVIIAKGDRLSVDGYLGIATILGRAID